MAPKKSTAATVTPNGEASEATQAFKWEGPNDFKLLLLIQGRHALPDEYERLATAFPGVSTGGIRNRVSNLRVKQRELYDSLGWTLPENMAAGAGKRVTKTKTKKRGAEEAETEAGDESPRKKAATMTTMTPRKKRGGDEVDPKGHVAETPGKKGRGKGKKKEVKEEERSAGEAEAEADESVKTEEVEG